MITPRFRIEQTEKDVTLYIHAPYTDVNETDIHVDQDQVCFYSKPYYLRLHLPGQVIEDDRSKGNFDADKGEYMICLPKANQGQHFEGLDMINALINPQKIKPAPNIEVLGGEPSNILPSQHFEDFDWFVEQEMEEIPILSIDTPKYGFGNTKSGVFHNVESELAELLELQSPDSTPSSQRAALQQVAEDASFSAEHYLADWAEEGLLVAPLLELKLPWESQENDELSAVEQDRLLKLPRRDLIPLDKCECRSAMLGLAELIFCWVHEQRSSLGDPGPESARSVRRLSATLGWLREFHSAKQLTLSCVRRALCVPLYRSWSLAMRTLQDTQQLLRKGRVRVLRVLLDLLAMFALCESHHVLSQLYLEPYCIWLQTVPNEAFISLAAAIEKATPTKAEVGWELTELESAGRLALEEEAAQDLASQVTARLHISKRTDDSDDCSATSSDIEPDSSSGDYSCSDGDTPASKPNV